MCDGAFERGSQILRPFHSDAKYVCRLGQLSEIGIHKVRAIVDKTGGLHFELYETQCAVVEYHQLHWKIQLLEGQYVSEQHRQPAIA